MDREGYTYLPNVESNRCFGCGPANPSGLQMKYYTDGKSVASWLSVPSHMTGWRNLAHGGILATILDEIMGRSVIYFASRVPMTKSMEIEFLSPVITGVEIKAEGKIIREDGREALVQGVIFNAAGEVCARSKGRFGLYTLEFMKKKGVDTEMYEQWFEQMKKLRAAAD